MHFWLKSPFSLATERYAVKLKRKACCFTLQQVIHMCPFYIHPHIIYYMISPRSCPHRISCEIEGEGGGGGGYTVAVFPIRHTHIHTHLKFDLFINGHCGLFHAFSGRSTRLIKLTPESALPKTCSKNSSGLDGRITTFHWICFTRVWGQLMHLQEL